MTHRQYSRVLLADNLIVVWMLAGDGLHYTAINAGRDCRLLLSQVLQVSLSQVSRDAPACSDQSDDKDECGHQERQNCRNCQEQATCMNTSWQLLAYAI